MALATSLRSVASKLMAKFGGEVTYRSVTAGAYNTTTGASAETVTNIDIRGVIEDVRRSEVNDLVQQGDKRLIIAALDLNGTTPTTADRIVLNNRSLQIIEVRTIEQDNTAITYELILRD
jgi:hypothetical protein